MRAKLASAGAASLICLCRQRAKANGAGRESYIGTYRLNLKNLLEHGYIAHDPAPGKVRVKFVHVNGTILLARGKKSPGLVVGVWRAQ